MPSNYFEHHISCYSGILYHFLPLYKGVTSVQYPTLHFSKILGMSCHVNINNKAITIKPFGTPKLLIASSFKIKKNDHHYIFFFYGLPLVSHECSFGNLLSR